ncbi:MAG: RNA pseudouridine synthase [Magnetococcales bacterium]|nr:RNA pseudouridine synthase [Magnetococcales bacterium]
MSLRESRRRKREPWEYHVPGYDHIDKSALEDEMILHIDRDILVINKPNRLPLYKGPGGGPVLADRLDGWRFGRKGRPSPVHRLDAATSGCLVLGRHRAARREISDLFASGRVEKRYLAIVQGSPPRSQGTINLPLFDNGWPGRPRILVSDQGKMGETNYTIVAANDALALLLLIPKTGRTHQLRVHCAAAGCPILGDPLYGGEPVDGRAMHLHAATISLPLDTPLTLTAPLPPEMNQTLADLVEDADTWWQSFRTRMRDSMKQSSAA